MNTILALFVAVLWTSVSSTEEYKRTDLKAFTEDMVNYINGLNTTWKVSSDVVHTTVQHRIYCTVCTVLRTACTLHVHGPADAVKIQYIP